MCLLERPAWKSCWSVLVFLAGREEHVSQLIPDLWFCAAGRTERLCFSLSFLLWQSKGRVWSSTCCEENPAEHVNHQLVQQNPLVCFIVPSSLIEPHVGRWHCAPLTPTTLKEQFTQKSNPVRWSVGSPPNVSGSPPEHVTAAVLSEAVEAPISQTDVTSCWRPF